MSSRVFHLERSRFVNWCCKSTGVWALVVIIGLFGFSFLILTPVYDTNDDPSMALVASGYGNAGGPDEHLLYTNVLIGHVLKQLYEAAPLIPWYGCYLLVIQFLAHWILLYALLSLNRTYFSVLGYILFYLTVGVYCLTHLQFTTTAFLIGMAGLSMILSSLILDAQGPHHRWLKWGGALCLIASSLIRYASLQLPILASIPLLVCIVFHLFRSINFRWYLLPAALTVISVLGCHFYDRHYYQQDEDWNHFLQRHDVAAKLINFAQIPVTDQTKPLFAQVGWSSFDYWMLRNWIYLDSETYSLSRMQEFKKQTDALSLRKIPQVMTYRVNMFKAAFSHPIFVVCSLSALFLAWLNPRALWQRTIVKWMLMWSALIMLGLISSMKLPERIVIPLGALSFYFTMFLNLPLLISQIDLKEFNKNLVFRLGALMLLLAACVICRGEVQRSDQNVKYNARLKQDIQYLQQKWPDKVFLSVYTFPIEHFLPLDNQSEIRNLKYLYLTGRQGSPLFNEKIKGYGIKSPYTDLYETDRLYLLFHPKMIPVLKIYFKQHYGVDLEFNSVYEGGYFQVYPVTLAEDVTNRSATTASTGKEE